MLQAHKLYDTIHDIDLSTMDAKRVGEVSFCHCFRPIHSYIYKP